MSTISVKDKMHILDINLIELRAQSSGNNRVSPQLIEITEDFYNQCINYLEEEQRYEDCALFRDNKNILLGIGGCRSNTSK